MQAESDAGAMADVGGPAFSSARHFVGAYNAGVAVAWTLPLVAKHLTVPGGGTGAPV